MLQLSNLLILLFLFVLLTCGIVFALFGSSKKSNRNHDNPVSQTREAGLFVS